MRVADMGANFEGQRSGAQAEFRGEWMLSRHGVQKQGASKVALGAARGR